jgi:spore coat protein CotH
MLEPIDEHFAADRFGRKDVPIFKPVTYSLFEDLGDDWSAYEKIYDLKTKATPEQRRRIIDFARLLTSASDEEFASRAGEFLDMDATARFLAGEVLLSSYDSILALCQNFYMYLDPRSNRLGFIPWDLDSAWGDFWLGTREELANASISHPWVGQNRLFERLMELGDFRQKYRSHLEDFLDRIFVPARLHKKMDELATVLRDPIASESSFRLQKFEQTVGLKPVQRMPGETRQGLRARAYPFMRFIESRAQSVRAQLDGKSPGHTVKLPAEK